MHAGKHKRLAWIKYPLLALFAGSGLAGGIYLSGVTGRPVPTPSALASTVCRFPLAAADIKERNEAPEVAVDSAGRIYLAWASQTGAAERTLFLTHSDNAGKSFAAPAPVARTGIVQSVSHMRVKTITRDSRMAPHLATHGNQVYLAWSETLPDGGGLRMVVADSVDRGATFCTPISVHQGDGARATYSAFAVGPNGALLCSWLDNRNKSQQTYTSNRSPGQPAFDAEVCVHGGDADKGVCPCCPTACLIGPDGANYVAFRNIADGYRDIVIGRKKAGDAHYELFAVTAPTWKFNGCPHDGPSLAIIGDVMHVAWMDARTGSPRCYHGRASLADMKFTTSELNPIAKGSQGNAKLFAGTDGTLHAVWEESLRETEGLKHDHAAPGVGGGRAILHAVWSAETGAFMGAAAVAPRDGAFQSRPSIAGASTGKVAVAFSELDEAGKSVVVATLDCSPGVRR